MTADSVGTVSTVEPGRVEDFAKGRCVRGVLIVASATALLLSGCGSGGDSAQPASSQLSATTTTAKSPGDTEYESAIALATALEKSGVVVSCHPTATGGTGISTFAECAEPTTLTGRKPLHFTVWNTAELADAGIKAGLEFSQSLANLGGPPYFAVVGKNWMIDADRDGNAARMIAESFGGKVRSTL